MTSDPLVSVALCTYNGEAFIDEQIQSILYQSCKNIEIIIVDDLSTDRTREKLAKLAAADSRIKLFFNDVNLGFNKNFEKAISLSTGDLVAVSDQDDIWELNKLERLMHNIGDNWIIFSNSVLINNDGTLINKKLLHQFKFSKRTFRSILLANFVTGHTCLIKREFLSKALPFPDKGYYDWWIGFIALYHNKLTYLDEALTRYRVHENSVTQLEYNDAASRKLYFELTLTMLDTFITYPFLAIKDALFLRALRRSYAKKGEKGFNLMLTLVLGLHYNEFFPTLKKRSFFSALNFARKFTKKIE